MIFEPQAKLLWHGDRVKEWIESGRTSPILAEIAPTGYCNATCPWCFFTEKHGKNKIDRKVMMQALEDLSSLGCEAVNWSGGGEPTLHPNFKDFVDKASDLGLKQGLFTHGYSPVPNQEKFAWIRISLTDKGLKKVVPPTIPFGVCINQIAEYTESDLRRICLEAKALGAKYCQVRPALAANYKDQAVIIPPRYLHEYEDDQFLVFITDYKYEECIKPRDYGTCYGYHFCPSIDWNGNLLVCMYMTLEKEYVLGNLNERRLKDIWKEIPKEVDVIDKCQNCCKNHEINKILYRAKNVTEESFL